ncbi:MAG: hypothetical protein SPI88_00990 [Bacilli bacterium]|nr:hypothetical protein [Bacilli bacterium]
MEPWLIGLLVVLAAILLYFLLGVISYLLLKKQKKSCDEELAKLVDEERNRGEKVLEILDVLISKGFKFDKESYDEIKVYKDNLEKLNSNERYKYKSTLDFVALYLLKVNREDKKFSKIISPYVEELKNIRDNQEIFISYNKKATKYNILYSMSFTRFVLLFKKDKGTNYSIY